MILMIKIAICDDDKKDRDQFKEFIDRYEKECNIKFCLQSFASGEELLESPFMPDIIFLDIVMDKKDGIKVGVEIKKRKPETLIIYTTLLNEKMSVALNHVHSFGYFEKPVDRENFFKILSDAVQMLQNRDQREEKIRFRSDANTILELVAMDIYYFEYKDRKIKIATKDDMYICKGKIKDIARQMNQYGFETAHQSFVINLYRVEKIYAHTLVMQGGKELPLAQKRASAFRKRLMEEVRKE